jgi:hypothetical protein
MKKLKGVWLDGGATEPLYDVFVKVHAEIANSYGWHGTTFFLPAHKYFLWMFETALIYTAYLKRDVLGITEKEACSITLPYWDWLMDADMNVNDNVWPSYDSPVLDSRVMGSWDVDPQTLYVRDGYFATSDWVMVNDICSDPNDPDSNYGPNNDKHLKRAFLYDYMFDIDNPTAIKNIASSTNSGFQAFSGWLEGRPHGRAHLFVWESMSIMFSPDDPLFFLHHCNIDRLYHFWADCWEYDAFSSIDSTKTKQYSGYNPVSYPYGKASKNPYTKLNYDVGLGSKIPFYYSGPSTDSYIFPVKDFPTPQQLWSMGDATTKGYDGIYYRYGPDNLAINFGSSCTKNIVWRWVNQKLPTSKRTVDDEEIEDDTHPRLAHVKEQGRYFREEVAKGRSHEEVLHELATANCHTISKLDVTDRRLLDWARMNNNDLSKWDTPCDKVSERLTQEGSQNAQVSETSAGGSFVPLWVILSASIGTAIILITVIVLIIIFLRKRAQNAPNAEYSYAEMKE